MGINPEGWTLTKVMGGGEGGKKESGKGKCPKKIQAK